MKPSAGEQATMREAVDWMVRLQSPAAPADTSQQLQRWLQRSEQHRQAWQQLQHLQQQFAQVRDVAARHPGQAEQAHRLLQRPSRRAALGSLAALAVTGGLAAAWTDRQFPLRDLSADLRTATAQRQRFALDDGSTVLLDARSALDVDFTTQTRGLMLRNGGLLLQVVPGPRPALLRSLHAQVSLLRGELMLQRDEYGSTVAALADHTLLEASDGSRLQLLAGQAARVHAHGIERLPQAADQLAAWQQGKLILDDAPLAELIDRLRPYRRGFLRLSPAAAALRVQGVFDLDQGDRSLAAIAETLPVVIRHHGPLTLIERS